MSILNEESQIYRFFLMLNITVPLPVCNYTKNQHSGRNYVNTWFPFRFFFVKSVQR